jgi:hypothetical protein
VDTSHSTQFAHDLDPAQTMDKSSLQGEHAPKFVGGDLVDPVDTARGAAAAAGSVDKSHPHGVYSLVSALGRRAVRHWDGHSVTFRVSCVWPMWHCRASVCSWSGHVLQHVC